MNKCTHADDLKTQKINALHRLSKIQEIAWKAQTIDMACNDWIWYWTNIKKFKWRNCLRKSHMLDTQITFSIISLITYKSHNYVYIWWRKITHLLDAQIAFSNILTTYKSHNYVYIYKMWKKWCIYRMYKMTQWHWATWDF